MRRPRVITERFLKQARATGGLGEDDRAVSMLSPYATGAMALLIGWVVLQGGCRNKFKEPPLLGASVTAAWQAQGAIPGVFALYAPPLFAETYAELRERVRYLEEPVVRGFRFERTVRGALAELPDPRAPFALDLSGTDVTDEDLGELRRFPNLIAFYLRYTNISSKGLKHVARLPELQVLDVMHTQVDSLAPLYGNTKLRTLCAGGPHLDDNGTRAVATMTGLRSLDLGASPVGDTTCQHIASLTKLEVLSLDATRVTDAGIARLKGLRGLKNLNLVRTHVSRQAVERLLKSLPDCRVSGP